MAEQEGGHARTTERPPAAGGTALLIIDMFNTLDFEGGQEMVPAATRAADAIASLRDAATRAGVPVVYVNDNYDQWHSERSRLVAMCLADGCRGRPLAERLEPRPDDYFVIKPQFSGFYSTNLPVLLPRLGVSRLILTGIAADICVLFTAADAHMRQYALWVPEDAVASPDAQRTEWALEIMRVSMKADTRATADLPLGDWLAAA
jgi:nicotinamidase-related amidase